MMTREERQKLRDAALTAVNGTRARRDQRVAALAADWTLWTSNSFRRISGHGDGDVLCGTKHPIDGHPDLHAAPGVLDYVVAAQPRVVLQLLDDVDMLEGKLDQAKALCDKIVGIEVRLDGLSNINAALATVVRVLASDDDSLAVAKARVIVDHIVSMLREVGR